MKKWFLAVTVAAALCLPQIAYAQQSVVAPVPATTSQDAIDLHQVSVYNSPADVANWPVTASITHLDMRSPAGLSFRFTAENSWPDYIPQGWTGPLQYTVWAVVNVNGRWATSGFIQMWKGRPSTGAPILSDFAQNWVYDGRWGTMAGYQPHPGEIMGFFLTAGDARGQGGATSVRERTNVVTVALPANDTGSFDFASGGYPPIYTPPPAPQPIPTPLPVPPVSLPPPSISTDYTRLLEQILQSQNMLLSAQHDLLVVAQDTNAHVVNIDRTFAQTMGSVSKFVGKYIAPAIGGFLLAKKAGN